MRNKRIKCSMTVKQKMYIKYGLENFMGRQKLADIGVDGRINFHDDEPMDTVVTEKCL